MQLLSSTYESNPREKLCDHASKDAAGGALLETAVVDFFLQPRCHDRRSKGAILVGSSVILAHPVENALRPALCNPECETAAAIYCESGTSCQPGVGGYTCGELET